MDLTDEIREKVRIRAEPQGDTEQGGVSRSSQPLQWQSPALSGFTIKTGISTGRERKTRSRLEKTTVWPEMGTECSLSVLTINLQKNIRRQNFLYQDKWKQGKTDQACQWLFRRRADPVFQSGYGHRTEMSLIYQYQAGLLCHKMLQVCFAEIGNVRRGEGFLPKAVEGHTDANPVE